MKPITILAAFGLCVMLAAVFWFAPKLQDKAEFHKFENDVREFGRVYLMFQREQGRPPKSIEELQPLIDKAARTTRERAKNDEFMVAWGVKIDPDLPGSRQRVIIIGKPVVQGKQVAIMQDGSVRSYDNIEIKKMEMATVDEGSSKEK